MREGEGGGEHVARPDVIATTALGVTPLAGLGLGVR